MNTNLIDDFMRREIAARAKKTEEALHNAILGKLCGRGRLVSGEVIARIEQPYGGYVEYFIQ